MNAKDTLTAKLWNKFHKDPLNKEEKPSRLIYEVPKILSSGNVLDLGCGVGANALHLAREGFNVHAVDLSDIAITTLTAEVSKRRLNNVRTEIASLGDYKIGEIYDIILASKTLHFLYREEALELIKQMQEHTSNNGLNLIVNKRDLAPEYTNDKAYRFFTAEGELAKLYEDKGWKIVKYEETDFGTLNLMKDPPQIIEQKHALLLAQKI